MLFVRSSIDSLWKAVQWAQPSVQLALRRGHGPSPSALLALL